MTIKINETEYDEADLNADTKFAVSQLQIATDKIVALNVDLFTQKIIAEYHSKVIRENLPSSDQSEESIINIDGDFNG